MRWYVAPLGRGRAAETSVTGAAARAPGRARRGHDAACRAAPHAPRRPGIGRSVAERWRTARFAAPTPHVAARSLDVARRCRSPVARTPPTPPAAPGAALWPARYPAAAPRRPAVATVAARWPDR